MNILEKAEPTAMVRHIERFPKSGIHIPTSRRRLVGKREEGGKEKQHMQLQSVFRFMQTQ